MSNLSDYLTAAEAIDRLALQYQQMSLASSALRDLARYEQMRAEGEAAQEKAAGLMREAQLRTEAAAIAVTEAETKAAQIIGDAKRDIFNLDVEAAAHRKAQDDATQIECERRLKSADAAAARITEGARGELERLQGEVDAETAELVNLQARRDALKEEIASNEAKLTAAKAAVANLMGA